MLDDLGNVTVFDATTLTNADARLVIEPPNGTVSLSGNTAKLVHLAAATLGVTVDAENGHSTRIQGGRFVIDGALEVTTIGTPGTPWSFFSG